MISMFNKYAVNKKQNLYILLVVFTILFLFLRLPGIDLPFHQDEWKNVSASQNIESAGQFFAHPPLMQILFVISNTILGNDNMRLFPLFFSILTGLLLFFIIRKRNNQKTAFLSLFFFGICFYSIWSSLMTDVDGGVLPLLFLLAVYCYDNFLEKKDNKKEKIFWLILFAIVLIVGLLTKLSFIIVIGVFYLDYFLKSFRSFDWKSYAKIVCSFLVFIGLYVALLYLIQVIYPAFSIDFMLQHANSYGEGGRNWMQILIQLAKAIFYLSPLLVFPVLLSSKKDLQKNSVFYIYLILGIIFYIIIFDFSRGALDKYLMYAIVPLVVITASIFSENIDNGIFKNKKTIVGGVFISLFLLSLNFLPQHLYALYPKSEWFLRVLHGQFNSLTPFNGGSGPLGFYVSFLFIAFSFIVTLILIAFIKRKQEWKSYLLFFILAIGICYNLVFAEELLWGKINGNTTYVLRSAISFIENNNSIKKVMTYNDIGAQYLDMMGKYGGRIYAVPEYEANYRKKFASFDGYYLIVDVPHIYEKSFYGKFFAGCSILYERQSRNINGRIYDCLHNREFINNI